jgi:hypothetical protein
MTTPQRSDFIVLYIFNPAYPDGEAIDSFIETIARALKWLAMTPRVVDWIGKEKVARLDLVEVKGRHTDTDFGTLLLTLVHSSRCWYTDSLEHLHHV